MGVRALFCGVIKFNTNLLGTHVVVFHHCKSFVRSFSLFLKETYYNDCFNVPNHIVRKHDADPRPKILSFVV